MNPVARKNAIYSLVLLLLMAMVYVYRKNEKGPEPIALAGTTMGKIGYSIKYFDKEQRNFQQEIDSIFVVFNQSLSTYIPSSEISRFNRQDSLVYESPFFYPVLQSSQAVYQATKGAFDPTVMPLVNAWGFGPESREEMTQAKVDSILAFVGFDKIAFDTQGLKKTQAGVALDFSAIAKGYAIDVVAEFLLSKGITNYMVLLGGEARCQGSNGVRDGWAIGIDNPKYESEGGTVGVAYVALKNKSVATSGNYRNFYVKDGKKYAHTINPATGYPIEHNLLSASVFAKDCMTADAYATALMVLGKEEGLKLVQQLSEIDVFLVYEEDGAMKTYMTAGVESMLLKD